jgi:hypothetical protein
MTPYATHPSLEKIQRFCDGTLPDFEQVSLETHLAGCDECLGIVSRMDGMLYSGFTAEAHAAALEAEARAADPLVNAIREAIDTYHGFSSALRDWLGDAAAVWGSMRPRQFGEAGLLPINASDAPESVRVVLRPGETRALVEVQESGQTVEVECDAPAGSLVLLFWSREEVSVRPAELRTAGDKRIARFEDVPAGTYRLAIGPAPKDYRK